MKELVRKALAVAAFLVLFSFVLSAQRQTPGRPSLDIYASFSPMEKGADVVGGGGFAWCNYNYNGRTTIGLDVYREPRLYVEEAIFDKNGEEVAPEERHDMSMWDVCATGGYLYRLWAPRSRVFIVSVGATLLVGASYCPPMSAFVKSNGKNYSQVGFLLGVVPEFQAELFIARNVSLYGAARPRVTALNTLGGKSEWLRFTAAGGLKIYL